jgi:hypothetical protein
VDLVRYADVSSHKIETGIDVASRTEGFLSTSYFHLLPKFGALGVLIDWARQCQAS